MIRIGILTYFASINYGAFLQSYALQKYMENEFHNAAEVEIVNYNSKIAHDTYLDRMIYVDTKLRHKVMKQYDLFLESRKKLKLSAEALTTDNIGRLRDFLENKYDILIAGSDEIWKTDSFRGFPNGYWMNFALGKTMYMAYAVSGRSDYQKLPKGMQEYIRSAMGRYAYIGTRDEVTRRELLKIKDRVIDRNCDPVFLMPQLFRLVGEENRVRTEKYGWNPKKPLISIMMNDRGIGTLLYRMLKNDNQVVYLYNLNADIDEGNLVELSPFDWNEVIGISDLVITDFFHGVAFSILHGTPFVALENGKKGYGKIETLLHENYMADAFLYREDYGGNSRKLAIELYTRGRREMEYYDPSKAARAVVRERSKKDIFLDSLNRMITQIGG